MTFLASFLKTETLVMENYCPFAILQFSNPFEMFREVGKLPKCKVISQKMAVELTILWGSFFFLENFFPVPTQTNFSLGLCLKIFFWSQITQTLAYVLGINLQVE